MSVPLRSHIIPLDKKRFLFLSKWIFLVLTIFLIVYEGTNSLNALRSSHYQLFFGWETRFPFIPAFIFIYFSSFFSFVLPSMFSKFDEVNLLCLRYIFIILLSGLIFLIFPTKLGFDRSNSVDSLNAIFSVLYVIDKPHNLFPSLHISFSATTVMSFLDSKYGKFRWFLIFWMILMTISVVAVHQHHLADIIGGFVVSILGINIIREPGILKFSLNDAD